MLSLPGVSSRTKRTPKSVRFSRFSALVAVPSGSVISQILQPLDALGHGWVCAEQLSDAAGSQWIHNIHLSLGRIHIHREPMIPIFQFEHRIGKGYRPAAHFRARAIGLMFPAAI